MPPAPLKTPLFDWHAAHGGRMVDFGGWAMPVQYGSIVDEHRQTRRAAGVFDISHMGRLRFDGPEAMRWLDSLLTRRVDNLAPRRIRYSLVTNEAGGVLDDVLVYRLADLDGREYYLLVVNAGNREKIVAWIMQHLPAGLVGTPLPVREGSGESQALRPPRPSPGLSPQGRGVNLTPLPVREGPGEGQSHDVTMTDLTFDTGMIAVQGPAALALMRPLVNVELPTMKYYSVQNARIGSTAGLVSRTGYTGEDGVELIVPARDLLGVWTEILKSGHAAKEAGHTAKEAGRAAGAVPVGLGARDTLRLEAAMPLYGHELTEDINPYQAGLAFAVDLEGRRFPGRDALAEAREDSSLPRRVGLECAGRRVPREGHAVLERGERVGEVTSGTFSPTFERPIAMAYVAREAAATGTEVAIDIRGREEPARVVDFPFYNRPKQ